LPRNIKQKSEIVLLTLSTSEVIGLELLNCFWCILLKFGVIFLFTEAVDSLLPVVWMFSVDIAGFCASAETFSFSFATNLIFSLCLPVSTLAVKDDTF